ncbi:MAG: hypothetical protein QOG43_2173 [Actinomycetota bacterium]|nr:hypothetical protein [Actinomycetota bacterium]
MGEGRNYWGTDLGGVEPKSFNPKEGRMGTRLPKRYQEDMAPEVGKAMWRQGYIEPWELLRIAVWKSAIGGAALSVEEPDRIRSVTRSVLSILQPYRDATAAEKLSGAVVEREAFLEATRLAIGFGPKGDAGSGLRSLHGIQLRVATAVLNTLNPNAWPVVDRWAVRTVFAQPWPDPGRLDVYWQYLERLAEIQRRWHQDLTIHEVDLLAMNLGMNEEEPLFDRIAFVTG